MSQRQAFRIVEDRFVPLPEGVPSSLGIYDLRASPDDGDYFSPGSTGTISFQNHPVDATPRGFPAVTGESFTYSIALPDGLTPDLDDHGDCHASTTEYWMTACVLEPSKITYTITRLGASTENAYGTASLKTFRVTATEDLPAVPTTLLVTGTMAPAASDVHSAPSRALLQTADVNYRRTHALLSPGPNSTVSPDTTFVGTGVSGESVTVRDGRFGEALGTTTVDSTGSWALVLNAPSRYGDTDLTIEFDGRGTSTRITVGSFRLIEWVG